MRDGTDDSIEGLLVNRRPGEAFVVEQLHEDFADRAIDAKGVAILEGAKSDCQDIHQQSALGIGWLSLEEEARLDKALYFGGVVGNENRFFHFNLGKIQSCSSLYNSAPN